MAEVEVYTNKGCPACVNVKHYLDRKGVNYTEKQLGKSKKVDIEFSIRTRGANKFLRSLLMMNGLEASTM